MIDPEESVGADVMRIEKWNDAADHEAGAPPDEVVTINEEVVVVQNEG